MYPPMNHFARARQDELLRTVDQGTDPSFVQVDMVRSRGQGFIRRLIGAFSRRKMLPISDPANYRREYQELRQP